MSRSSGWLSVRLSCSVRCSCSVTSRERLLSKSKSSALANEPPWRDPRLAQPESLCPGISFSSLRCPPVLSNCSWLSSPCSSKPSEASATFSSGLSDSLGDCCPPLSSSSSSGLRSSSASTNAWSSKFDICRSLIACCSCGVITSPCDCRNSSFGIIAMTDRQQTCNSGMRPAPGAMTLKTEFFAQIEAPDLGIVHDLLRIALHQYPAFMNDERSVDELKGLADVVIRNKHPDAPRGELSNP